MLGLQESKSFLIAVPSLTDYSGDAIVAVQQAKELAERGATVEIVSIESDRALEGDRGCGVFAALPSATNPKFVMRLLRLIFPISPGGVRALLETKRFDTVISHQYPMHWVGVFAKVIYGRSFVVWYHGVPSPDTFGRWIERSYMRLFIALMRTTVRQADKVVSVSEYASSQLFQYAGIRSEIQLNSPDPSLFNKNADGEHLRRLFHLEGKRVLLCVGRVTESKGMARLPRLLQTMGSSSKDVVVLVVGEVFDSTLKMRVEEADSRIRFVGSVPHSSMSDYYGLADILISLSQDETYNLPMVEARMCGKPAVVLATGAHREIAGTDGMIVVAEDLDELAKSCVSLLTVPISSVAKDESRPLHGGR